MLCSTTCVENPFHDFHCMHILCAHWFFCVFDAVMRLSGTNPIDQKLKWIYALSRIEYIIIISKRFHIIFVLCSAIQMVAEKKNTKKPIFIFELFLFSSIQNRYQQWHYSIFFESLDINTNTFYANYAIYFLYIWNNFRLSIEYTERLK